MHYAKTLVTLCSRHFAYFRGEVQEGAFSFTWIPTVFPKPERPTTPKLDGHWEVTFKHITYDEKACVLAYEYFIEQSACE